MRTLPSSTVATFSFRAMPPMSSFFPLNAKDEVRAATRSAWILVSALMISSAMPSVKYSFSGSALMLTNGRTAIDFAVTASDDWLPGGVAPPEEEGPARAWPNCTAVAYRIAGSFASALPTASSTHSGTVSRNACRAGTGSVNAWAMMAWAVGPVYGVRAVSISNSTHPRLYTSLRPSRSTSPLACSGLM